jgi:hypothetical protein
VPKPSDLARLRARRADELAAVLHPGEAGYEETLRYALRDPLFDTITTRLRFTSVAETEALVVGLGDELTRRGIKA